MMRHCLASFPRGVPPRPAPPASRRGPHPCSRGDSAATRPLVAWIGVNATLSSPEDLRELIGQRLGTARELEQVLAEQGAERGVGDLREGGLEALAHPADPHPQAMADHVAGHRALAHQVRGDSIVELPVVHPAMSCRLSSWFLASGATRASL